MESMGMTSVRPPNPAASGRDAMEEFWRNAGLQSIETGVMHIQTVYADFDDFWRSNTPPIGPQGKMIAEMSAGARDELRARLSDHLPAPSNGHLAYPAFANA